MNAVTVACTLVQWLQVYNVHAIHLMTGFLGISVLGDQMDQDAKLRHVRAQMPHLWM